MLTRKDFYSFCDVVALFFTSFSATLLGYDLVS